MKNEIRKKYLSIRDAAPKSEICTKSEDILSKVTQLDLYKKAERVFTYINIGSEVRTKELIERAWGDNKKVCVPVALKNRIMYFVDIYGFDCLQKKLFGVLEPNIKPEFQKFPEPLDLFIVPGSVFDMDKYRFGYGGGYYDKYIRENKVSNKVGLAFDFQMVGCLPKDDFDERLDIIITDKKIII